MNRELDSQESITINHNPYNNYMKKILITFIFILPLIINADKKVADIFSPEYRNQLFMDVEVALAEAQAELGIIPEWAANEIKSKANLKHTPKTTSERRILNCSAFSFTPSLTPTCAPKTPPIIKRIAKRASTV